MVGGGEIVGLIRPNGAGNTTARFPADRVVALWLARVPEGQRIFPVLTVAESLRAGRPPKTTSVESQKKPGARL